MMKVFSMILSAVFFLASCDKPINVHPQMLYTDLENKAVACNDSYSIDLNKDGVTDVRFYTLLVGDPVSKQDKRKYMVSSKINCLLPLTSNENAPLLLKGEVVPLENFSGYTWYGIAQFELAQKVIGITGDPFWEGLWKSASHSYLPVHVTLGNQRFDGWVELTFDRNTEKVILHKAALSKLPESEVIAGL